MNGGEYNTHTQTQNNKTTNNNNNIEEIKNM